jgi:hypothetical protein
MKKMIIKSIFLVLVFGVITKSTAQTQGTLTFSFTPTAHTPANHALAVWIGIGSAFGFTRTMNRYCDATTYNYLPTWAGLAQCGFQGTTLDATSLPCRIGGATIGGSLSSYTPINITWDGLNNYGNLDQDDNLNVAIEETWGIGSTKTAVRYFHFVKGPAVDDQTTGIANDANFTGISLIWQPNLATATFANAAATIYPNPSRNGVFNMDLQDTVSAIKVYNTLGALVYNETLLLEKNTSTKLDLYNFSNGIYIVNLSNEKGASNYKLVVEK